MKLWNRWVQHPYFSPAKYGLILFHGIICLYFSLDLISRPESATQRYIALTYPIYSFICLSWLMHLIYFCIQKRHFLYKNRSGILFCVLISVILSSFVFRASPQKLRIFDDAPDRLSTSIAFYQFQRCERLHAGFWVDDDTFKKMSVSRTARSPFFPYLTSLIHSISGYRIANIFFLNWLVLNAILILASLCVVFSYGKIAALCVQILILGQPLVLYVTESACYEGLGAVALMVLLCASFRVIAVKPSYHSVTFMLLASAVALHCRPEMVVIVSFVFGCTMLLSRSWLVSKASFLSISALFVSIMPFIWHRISFQWSYPTMNIKPAGGLGVAAPTVSKFADNPITAFIKALYVSIDSFLGIKNISAFNGLINYCFIALMVLFVVALFRKKVSVSPRHLLAAASPFLCIAFYVVLISLIGWSARHPNTARYFIPVPIGISVAVISLIYTLYRRHLNKTIVLSFCCVAFLSFFPNIINPTFFSTLNYMSSYYNASKDYLATQVTDKSLVVSTNGTYFLIHKWSSVEFQDFNRNLPKVMESLKNGVYDNVFIVQQMDKKFKHVWDSSDTVDPKVKYEIIHQKVIGSKIGIQISKVIL